MYIRNAGVTDVTCWLLALTLPLDTSNASVTSVLLPDSMGYSVSAWLGWTSDKAKFGLSTLPEPLSTHWYEPEGG